MRSTLLPCLVAFAILAPRVAHADEPPQEQKEQTVPSVMSPATPPAEPAPEPPPAEPPPSVPPPPEVLPPAAPPPMMIVQPDLESRSARRSTELRNGLAFTFVAAGVLTTAVGTLLITTGKSTYDDVVASAGCVDHACPADDADRANKARTQINAGGIVLVVGLASVAAGAVIWLTAPKPEQRAVGIAPLPGGLAAVGRF